MWLLQVKSQLQCLHSERTQIRTQSNLSNWMCLPMCRVYICQWRQSQPDTWYSVCAVMPNYPQKWCLNVVIIQHDARMIQRIRRTKPLATTGALSSDTACHSSAEKHTKDSEISWKEGSSYSNSQKLLWSQQRASLAGEVKHCLAASLKHNTSSL